MVGLPAIRTHNASLKTLSPGLVGVFVGGTSGIGFSTAREFVRNVEAPHVYLVGRNQAEATRIIDELQKLNPSSQLNFIKSDVSLLRSVDEVCKEIKQKESKVNLLFMTAGYLTFAGREETTEGLDRKFSLHYYARMRFVQQLSPLLTAAANTPDPNGSLSRVISVLDPNVRAIPNFEDLSLKATFSLKNCATHAIAMNNFALERWSKEMPGTSFIHTSPGIVPTGVARPLGPVWSGMMKLVVLTTKPWQIPLKESGERHLYAATAPQFAPKAKSERAGDSVKGLDGRAGSGAYAISSDVEIHEQNVRSNTLREEGAEKRIWEHTEEVFRKIEETGKY
ncbi:hypothetical protein BDV96DRAFT_651350 [Lophiotrema nucula]|uniref:Short-chain dehydrogenases/reductase n=1 Tax=Lophiotrema nucula TaxID=690887 RepID=A0A6A5YTX5_9PLEO|nr:hypothetical protein BDV96DRAFT_651350 [Lophiotrema nucula]